MPQAGLPYLSSWENYYIIVGTAAATLTGLMFIAITLIAGIEGRLATLNAAISAFNTPTVVFFGSVLLIAGILSVPWQAFSGAGLSLVLVGSGAVIYLLGVMQRMRQMPDYQTPLRDWLWYSVTPLAAYIILIAAGVMLLADPPLGLDIAGFVMAWLLFVGIRNAWDLVTYLAVDRSHPEN